jgi:hypothetical protein
MSLDVYGKRPSSKTGEYFRANVWSWRPIHDLIFQLCSDLLWRNGRTRGTSRYRHQAPSKIQHDAFRFLVGGITTSMILTWPTDSVHLRR